jgi:hypothetical protein
MKLTIAVMTTAICGLFIFTGCNKQTEQPNPTDQSKTQETAVLKATPADQAGQIKLVAGATHLKEILKYEKENLGDCAKALALAEKYFEGHKAELQRWEKLNRDPAEKEKLSDQEQSELLSAGLSLAGEEMQSLMKSHAQFEQTCKAEYQKIKAVFAAYQIMK